MELDRLKSLAGILEGKMPGPGSSPAVAINYIDSCVKPMRVSLERLKNSDHKATKAISDLEAYMDVIESAIARTRKK